MLIPIDFRLLTLSLMDPQFTLLLSVHIIHPTPLSELLNNDDNDNNNNNNNDNNNNNNKCSLVRSSICSSDRSSIPGSIHIVKFEA